MNQFDIVNARTATIEQVEKMVRYLRKHAYGKENAILVPRLARGIGLPYMPKGTAQYRVVRAMFARANHMGYPVCADTEGVFYAASDSEKEESIGQLRSRAASLLARAADLEGASCEQ